WQYAIRVCAAARTFRSKSMADIKTLTVDQFVELSRTKALQGYIAYSANNQDSILFGTMPFLCPRIPIPRQLIEKLEIGGSHSWADAQGGIQSRMWDATVYLKE